MVNHGAHRGGFYRFKGPVEVGTAVVSLEMLFGDDAQILRDPQYQLLLLSNINGAIGTILIAPILELLTDPFAVSEVEIGLMITAITAPSIVGIPLAGVIADRYGRKPVLVVSLALFGLAGGAIALTTDFRIVLFLRVLQGLGYSGIVPVIITAIGDMYTHTEEATAHGLRYSSSGISEAIIPVTAGALAAFAWQYPFLIYLSALPIALIVHLWFREPTRPAQPPSSGRPQRDQSYFRRIVGLITTPYGMAAIFALSVPGFFFTAFATYNSFIVVRVFNGSAVIAGLLISLFSLTAGIAGSQSGRLADLFGNQTLPLVIANVAMGLGLGLFSRGSLLLGAVSVSLLGVGLGLAFSLLRSIITDFASQELRGGFVSVAESTMRFTQSITPIVMGAIVVFFQQFTSFTDAVQLTLVGGSILVGAAGLVAIAVINTSHAQSTVNP